MDNVSMADSALRMGDEENGSSNTSLLSLPYEIRALIYKHYLADKTPISKTVRLPGGFSLFESCNFVMDEAMPLLFKPDKWFINLMVHGLPSHAEYWQALMCRVEEIQCAAVDDEKANARFNLYKEELKKKVGNKKAKAMVATCYHKDLNFSMEQPRDGWKTVVAQKKAKDEPTKFICHHSEVEFWIQRYKKGWRDAEGRNSAKLVTVCCDFCPGHGGLNYVSEITIGIEFLHEYLPFLQGHYYFDSFGRRATGAQSPFSRKNVHKSHRHHLMIDAYWLGATQQIYTQLIRQGHNFLKRKGQHWEAASEDVKKLMIKHWRGE